MPGRHPHRREGDGLLTGPAPPVQRHARHRVRPAGREYRHPGDVAAVVADSVAVAHHHVVDELRVEADAVGKRAQELAEQLLRMQVVQRAGGPALAAG